jgi:hypothetical protein
MSDSYLKAAIQILPRRVTGIDVRKLRHGFPLAEDVFSYDVTDAANCWTDVAFNAIRNTINTLHPDTRIPHQTWRAARQPASTG